MFYCLLGLGMGPGVVYPEPRLVLVAGAQRSDSKYDSSERKPLNNRLLNLELYIKFSQYFLFGTRENLNSVNGKYKSMRKGFLEDPVL